MIALLGWGILIVFGLFILTFIYLILFGSSIDPDDNGILRSELAREAYRQQKLKRFRG